MAYIQHLKHTVGLKQTQKLMPKIKLAGLMGLSEDKYQLLIRELEESRLFKRLMYSNDINERVLRYKPFSHSATSNSFYGFSQNINAENIAGGSSFDINSLLNGKEKTVQLIKRITEEKFSKYFLYNEDNLSLEEIAENCKIEKKDAAAIIELLNTIDVYNSFNTPGAGTKPIPGGEYTLIASIKKAPPNVLLCKTRHGGLSPRCIGGGSFVIEFFHISSARGKYIINFDRLEALKQQGFFSKKELKELNKLIENIKLINTKKETIYRILEEIIKKQRRFLESSNPDDLVPLSELELAGETGVHYSVVSRAISLRSVEIPSGKEMALKNFLPSKKDIRKVLIYKIISEEKAPYKDEEIREKLSSDYGINVSRRSVASCRSEINLPANYIRNKNN